MSNLNFVVQMSKDFSISSCFEPIDVITLRTPWWPQLHCTSFFYLLYEIFVLHGHSVLNKKSKAHLIPLCEQVTRMNYHTRHIFHFLPGP